MSTELEIRQLRDEIVSLRDEIRQLRRTIEHGHVPIVPYPYPTWPWWPGPYYPPAWWIWWSTGPATCEASYEINDGGSVTYGSMEAQRHSAQLDFPGFCRDYLAAVEERPGTWGTSAALADAYAHAHGGMGPGRIPDPDTGELMPVWHQLPKIGITHEHADLASAARQTPEDAAAKLKRLFS